MFTSIGVSSSSSSGWEREWPPRDLLLLVLLLSSSPFMKRRHSVELSYSGARSVKWSTSALLLIKFDSLITKPIYPFLRTLSDLYSKLSCSAISARIKHASLSYITSALYASVLAALSRISSKIAWVFNWTMLFQGYYCTILSRSARIFVSLKAWLMTGFPILTI